jgi:hypothetical protein
VLTTHNDPREVVTDPQARYFGINPSERALLPRADARVAETGFSDWLARQLAAALRSPSKTRHTNSSPTDPLPTKEAPDEPSSAVPAQR